MPVELMPVVMEQVMLACMYGTVGILAYVDGKCRDLTASMQNK